MERQLRLWPWFGIAGFALLGLALKAWSSRSTALLWLRIWAVWFLACLFGGLVTVRTLQGLRLAHTTWLLHWSNGDWQLNLWYLCTLPAMLALGRDLNTEHGDFRRSRLALAMGAALGPLALGSFSSGQIAAFVAPFVLLALCARILLRTSLSAVQVFATLALLNLLGFIHGLADLSPWLGSLLMAACLAFGLNPYRRRAAMTALAFAACGLALKFWLAWPPLASMLSTCLLIALGWLIQIPPVERDLAQTA